MAASDTDISQNGILIIQLESSRKQVVLLQQHYEECQHRMLSLHKENMDLQSKCRIFEMEVAQLKEDIVSIASHISCFYFFYSLFTGSITDRLCSWAVIPP
jgi:hypothetical protein